MDNRDKYSEIFGSTSKYSFLRIILFSTSYIFYIFITRLLGPEEFGKLALLIQLGTEIGTILVIGLPVALTRFIPEINSRKNRSIIFSKSLNISLLIFIGFGLIYFIIIYFFQGQIPREIIETKYYLFSFIVVIGFMKLGIGMLSGLGRFITGAIFDGSTHFIWRLAGMLVVVLFALNQFKLVFGICILIHLLITIIIFVVLKDYFTFSGFNIDKGIFKFSIIVMFSQTVFALIAVVDPLLIRIILNSPSEVGFFYAGTRIPLLFQTLFFAPLSIPFLYYFSRKDYKFKDKKIIIKFGSKILASIFALISLSLYSLADKLIIFLFGKAYYESIMILQIFSFTLFFVALEVFLNPYFLSINKPLIPVFLGIGYLVLVVVLDFIFIPIFKSLGPTISILIGLLLRVAVYFILLKKQKIPFVGTFLILSGILIASVAIDIFVLKYSGFFIFIGLLFAFKVIRIEDIKKLFSIIKRRKIEGL